MIIATVARKTTILTITNEGNKDVTYIDGNGTFGEST